MRTTTKTRLCTAFIAAAIILSSLTAPLPAGATEEQTVEAFGRRLIETGKAYLGTPYEFGASSDQTDTFDCSSFTQRVFKENGIALPRSSRQQYKVGRKVPLAKARVGDLVFFHSSNDPSRISHVGIYAGDGRVLHATASQGVTFSDFTDGYWASRFAGVRRIVNG